MPGQVVSVTAIDFTPTQTVSCQALGRIRELSNSHEVSICKNNRRKQHVYTSTGTGLEIQINRLAQNADVFLLHYKGKIYDVSLSILIL